MKKALFVFAVLGVTLMSCQKNNPAPNAPVAPLSTGSGETGGDNDGETGSNGGGSNLDTILFATTFNVNVLDTSIIEYIKVYELEDNDYVVVNNDTIAMFKINRENIKYINPTDSLIKTNYNTHEDDPVTTELIPDMYELNKQGFSSTSNGNGNAQRYVYCEIMLSNNTTIDTELLKETFKLDFHLNNDVQINNNDQKNITQYGDKIIIELD